MGNTHLQPDKIERRQSIISMRLEGMTYSAISKKLGISRQRVEQIASPPTDILAALRERAGGRCEICGLYIGKAGHAHHKGKDSETYEDINELQYLCISCHRRCHNGKRYGKREHRKLVAKIIKRRGKHTVFCDWCESEIPQITDAEKRGLVRRIYCSSQCQLNWQMFVCGGRRVDPLCSVFVGVYWNKDCAKWMAYLGRKSNGNGKMKYLGLFRTEVQAARAYNTEILRVYGDAAITNIIPQDFKNLLTNELTP